jgi:hypothetical protein
MLPGTCIYVYNIYTHIYIYIYIYMCIYVCRSVDMYYPSGASLWGVYPVHSVRNRNLLVGYIEMYTHR